MANVTIHVSPKALADNMKAGKTGAESVPAVIVRAFGNTYQCHRVRILGPSEIIHSETPAPGSGVRVWIETNAEVELDNYEPTE